VLRFDIQEMKGTNRLTIVYREPKPENFDSATSVEAVGTYRNGEFHAKNLLVKCPSKYNDKPQSSDSGSALVIVAGALGVGALAVGVPFLFNRGKAWS
jgi:cytochrome c-type biogenesis protein CcmE